MKINSLTSWIIVSLSYRFTTKGCNSSEKIPGTVVRLEDPTCDIFISNRGREGERLAERIL